MIETIWLIHIITSRLFPYMSTSSTALMSNSESGHTFTGGDGGSLSNTHVKK